MILSYVIRNKTAKKPSVEFEISMEEFHSTRKKKGSKYMLIYVCKKLLN